MEFTSSVGLSFGSVSAMEHVSQGKVVLGLASIFSGVILCLLVYRSTAFLSSLVFRAYRKLSTAKKIEWNNRGFSTFHALFISYASLYFIFLSDTFTDGSRPGDLVVNRSTTLSDTVLGISLGYFLTDLGMILWHFPALGGLEYVLHHGLSIFSILLSLLCGQVQIYTLMILLSEITTPFVNLRWYLDISGMKNSRFYIENGIALFVGWLVLSHTLGPQILKLFLDYCV